MPETPREPNFTRKSMTGMIFAAQVYDSTNKAGNLRHCRDGGGTDDFADVQDVYPVGFTLNSGTSDTYRPVLWP